MRAFIGSPALQILCRAILESAAYGTEGQRSLLQTSHYEAVKAVPVPPNPIVIVFWVVRVSD